MSLVAGTFRAKAVTGGLGYTSTEKPQVAVEFQILDEEFANEAITWFGYFTDDTKERTFESLRVMGWKTDDLSNLDGITENEVRIVVKEEEYQGKTSLKVAWVNKPGGLALKTPMSPQQAKAFAASMRGEALASRGGTATGGQRPTSQTKQTSQARPPAQHQAAPRGSRQAPPPESIDRHPDDGGDEFDRF
jgi:hypothetical protein